MAVDILDRPLYAVNEAARFLEIHTNKLRRWLEGAKVAGREYRPVIRPEPTGSDVVTWAEFVEAGFLREYREKRVSLQHMRPLIDAMRREFGVPYPLAHFKPLVDRSSRELVVKLQDQLQLDEELLLARRRGTGWQIQWEPAVRAFLEKVEFDPRGVAQRMYPLGRPTPVQIDPEKTFGIPQIRGIRTETIVQAYGPDGKTESEIAKEYGLSVSEVKAALRWEIRVMKRVA